ncbi:oligosaccharide flippase family protein [Luteolibacter pohnpeiensis]|uniref:Oligosaccharide flippase family protein n=1 Tax=Luteolibacter pohnpeiensis TaxID=454153 RepID=A0A934SBQ9_9BACT|nr:oligosaccharide flippase family protein [Luteolibacter pohnpeiensis]MBK1882378.1 oligosaccharide flippase family protein [Luteolibacter pohnpeiensis]
MPVTESNEAAVRRDRSIRLAVVTSLISKAGNILLQLVSIPVAFRVLGREEFGLYTTVSLTLTTIALLEIGVGPALTHGLSQARANHDSQRQRELGSTAFFLMVGLGLVAGILVGGLLALVPVVKLYGSEFAGYESQLRAGLWMGLAIFVCLFVLNLTERAREGHLEVASNNLWGAIGNLTAAAAVAGGIWFVPQVWFLVLAVHGSMVLAKIGNTIALWRKHPLMRPSVGAFRPSLAKHLFGDGISFSTCFLVTGVVEYNFCGWLVGRIGGGPANVALYGIFISLTVMQLGFVIMLSTPTWPAVAEALTRGDLDWARKAAKRLYRFGMSFALCSAVGMTLFGPWALHLWLGDRFGGTTHLAMGCYALYFVAHVWRHLNHAMMIGTGQVRRLAVIQIVESMLMIGITTMVLWLGSMEFMLAAMGITILCLTGWLLPRRVAAVLGKQTVVENV